MYRQTETALDQKETCPGCFGAKAQQRQDGIRLTYPVCGGKGWIYKQSEMFEYTTNISYTGTNTYL